MLKNGHEEDTPKKDVNGANNAVETDDEQVKFAMLLIIVFLQLMLVIFRVGTCVLSIILIRLFDLIEKIYSQVGLLL